MIDWMVGKPLRLTFWLLFPPLGWWMSRTHRRRTEVRVQAARHREMMRAISSPPRCAP